MNPEPDAWIEDALQTYPLAEPPPGFSRRVMFQVRQRPVTPKFRLTWLDYALGLLISLLTGGCLVVWLWLPARFWLWLRYQWLWLQRPGAQPELWLALAAAGLCLICGLLLAVLQSALAPRLVAARR